MSETLAVQPLTREAFAPYGEVIEAERGSAKEVYPVNDGRALRFHDIAGIDVAGGRGLISIFRSEAVTLPFAIRDMERHPQGSQAFVPMHAHPFLVVVAGGDARPALPVAFLTNGRQGVSFRRGTWHHPLLALAAGDFLVVDRDAPDENCDVGTLEPGYLVSALPTP